MKHFFLIIILGLNLFATPVTLYAGNNFKLPNYASGTGGVTEVQSKGKKFTTYISMAVGIICIIGMLIGAGYTGFGNPDKGKQYLLGGFVGLVLSSLIYGLANLAVS